MNRRTFNTILGGGAMSLAAEAWPKTEAPANSPTVEAQGQPAKWPDGAYRRLLVDTHVPDWDPHLLANFDPAEYVRIIADAGFTSVMEYAKSHVGLCLWQSKVGPLHANMKGRDYFGDVMQECHKRGLHTVAYYSLIFDIWAFDHFPDWRILPENGIDHILRGRPGVVCPNSPYRDRALAELRELVGNYDFEGIFLDMTFWPDVCYCAYCTERFRKEQGAEPPRTVNWDDPTWRAFQRAREQWISSLPWSSPRPSRTFAPSPSITNIPRSFTIGKALFLWPSVMLVTILAGTSMAAPLSIPWSAKPLRD